MCLDNCSRFAKFNISYNKVLSIYQLSPIKSKYWPKSFQTPKSPKKRKKKSSEKTLINFALHQTRVKKFLKLIKKSTQKYQHCRQLKIFLEQFPIFSLQKISTQAKIFPHKLNEKRNLQIFNFTLNLLKKLFIEMKKIELYKKKVIFFSIHTKKDELKHLLHMYHTVVSPRKFDILFK